MFSFEKSRSGHSVLKHCKRYIHSHYDPVKEAIRFLTEKLSETTYTAIIFIDPGIGYLEEECKKIFPEAKILTVHSTSTISNMSFFKGIKWSNECGTGLYHFLQKNLSGKELFHIKVIEWPPGLKVNPSISCKNIKIISQFISEQQGSMVTAAKFGERWLKNCFRNILIQSRFIEIPIVSKPVILCAAGPSLNSVIPFITKYRKYIHLWILSSALNFFLFHKIFPDLIFHSDGGFYSSYFLPQNIPPQIPIVHPLSARLPNYLINPSLIIDHSIFPETLLINAMNIPSFKTPPHGTVAGIALSTAIALTKPHIPIILVGLDLSYLDILEHCRPHFFENLLLEDPVKTNPYHSIIANRAFSLTSESGSANGMKIHNSIQKKARISCSLKTYAGWFEQQHFPDRVSRLVSSGLPVLKINEIDIEDVIDITENFKKLFLKFSVSDKSSKTHIINKADRKEILITVLKFLYNLPDQNDPNYEELIQYAFTEKATMKSNNSCALKKYIQRYLKSIIDTVFTYA